MNRARAAAAIMAPATATMSLPVKSTGPMVNDTWSGVLTDWLFEALMHDSLVAGLQKRMGARVATPVRSWASPIVATVRINRELLRKWRGNRLANAPRMMAAAMPAAAASTKGTPKVTTSSMASTAGSTPIWAWAKLMMRSPR